MSEMPKHGRLRRACRMLALILPPSAGGTLLVHAIVPGTPWDDAALLSTVFCVVVLVFVQRHFQLSRDPSQPASPLVSLIMSANLRPVAPEDLADAARLDREITRRPWLWPGLLVAAVGAGMALVHAIAPEVPWRKAFTLSFGSCLALLVLVLGPWYGYRKWTRRPAWKTFGVVCVLMLLGLLLGLAAPNARPLSAFEQEKVVRAVAIALLVAGAFAGITVGISQMRLREATQRAARLAAEAERETLARQNMQAELKLLQAQVEPHFLYNTLANVRHLAQADPRGATVMLDHLIDYLRVAVPEMREEASTLGRETQLARAYLEIMRLRMGGSLEIAIDLPCELAQELFPPLMLMTLVENAIKHGVAPAGRGRVEIAVRKRNGKILVTVHDDGSGLGGKLGRGVGLTNLRERLGVLFGAHGRLELESPADGGTRASIEIPADEG